MKQSATEAHSRVSDDHFPPGPSKCGGAFVSILGNCGDATVTLPALSAAAAQAGPRAAAPMSRHSGGLEFESTEMLGVSCSCTRQTTCCGRSSSAASHAYRFCWSFSAHWEACWHSD